MNEKIEPFLVLEERNNGYCAKIIDKRFKEYICYAPYAEDAVSLLSTMINEDIYKYLQGLSEMSFFVDMFPLDIKDNILIRKKSELKNRDDSFKMNPYIKIEEKKRWIVRIVSKNTNFMYEWSWKSEELALKNFEDNLKKRYDFFVKTYEKYQEIPDFSDWEIVEKYVKYIRIEKDIPEIKFKNYIRDFL